MKVPKIIKAVIIFVFTLLIVNGCDNAKKPQRAPLPEVTVSTLKKQNINLSVEYYGQAKASKKVELYAKVEGYLTKKNFEAGDYVKKGQLLFQISKKPYEIKLQSTKGGLEMALHNYSYAKKILKMYDKLNVEMAARERQYYKALKKYQLAQAEILIKKAAYARAKLHLKYTEIKAPFSGYVQKTNKDVGDLIRQYKYQNSALVKMKKTDPIWVEFSIPEAEIVSLTQKFTGNKEDAGNLSPDTKVKIILSNGTEYKHEGKVVYISVNVNPLTGTNLLRASFPNPNHIVFPGGYVTVKLSSKKKFNEIVIPQKAIQEDQSGNYVLAVDKKNKVHKRHIKLGIPYKNGFVVKTGLKQGEKIITEGLQMVHQGMKVKPVKGKPLSHMIHSKNLGEKSEDSIFDTMYLSSVNKSKKGSEGNAE